MWDIPQNCISLYFKTLFQIQNDLKYEVFHDMFAPTIRIKLDAEIENQKAINKVSLFNLK